MSCLCFEDYLRLFTDQGAVVDDHTKERASVRAGLSPLPIERRNEQTAQSGRFRTTRQDFATFLYAEQLGIFFWVVECAM